MTKLPTESAGKLPVSFDTRIVSPSDFKANDKVKISGRIINVMTLLPTRIFKQSNTGKDDDWGIEPVLGNSALYSSYYFLEQNTDWETHLVAWTGELIDRSPRLPLSSEDIDEDPLYLDEEDTKMLEGKLRKANKSSHVHPVWLLRRDQSRWRNYAEKVLWTIFHYIQAQPSDGKMEATWWYDYVRFNEAYLKKIKSIYKPGDIIWIHDYYLLLLPLLLRLEFPDAIIGLYIHTSFPSSEYFRCLSKRSQLLDGMLGADKISFQANTFRDHFMSSCSRVLGYETVDHSVLVYGSRVALEALPIGIDVKKTEYDAFSCPEVDSMIKAMREIYGDRKVIIGRDRLDPVRGVFQKLKAYEVFLQMYPEFRNKVVVVQVSSPCFSYSKKYAEKVSELVNHINNEYGGLHWLPVEHYQKRIKKSEYLALLRFADLAIVTSVRDGMNTTALEFVVCQKEKHSPLVLSEFTGTTSVLKDVTMVNPWDPVGVAKTIKDAFLMTEAEKTSLESKLYKDVISNTIQSWSSNFIASLIGHVNKTHQRLVTPALDRPMLLNNYRAAQRRLFLFDYDGTLTPIVKDPAAAIPSSRLNAILDALSADPKNEIWIISGRDQAFLDKWLGSKNIGLSAEHGCFMRDIKTKKWINLAASFDMSWQEKVLEVFKRYADRTPGANIERKKVALTWHYRMADPILGSFQAEKLTEELKSTVANQYDVEIMSGKANVEVRPKFVNKGEIVRRLVLNPHGSARTLAIRPSDDTSQDKLPDFTLCLGDDMTDEDMFRTLKDIEKMWLDKGYPRNQWGSYGVYPIVVGSASKQTLAKAHLTEPSEVLETLGLLTGKVSLFESAGSVVLDDRGHIENSTSSVRSKSAIKAARLRRKSSVNSTSLSSTNSTEKESKEPKNSS